MYKIVGKVIHGLGNGKKVGMPTANIDFNNIDEKIEYGVYGAIIYLDNKKYLGVCNVGSRPTIDDKKTIEVNILDFNQEIYNKEIEIDLIKKIRDIKKFDSLDKVKQQVDKDIKKVRELDLWMKKNY